MVPVGNYTSVYPAMNTLSVPSAVQDITLSINIEGKWTLPDNSESTNSVLTILNFSSQNNGLYKFCIINWDGVEVCVLQIELTTSKTINGMLLSLKTHHTMKYVFQYSKFTLRKSKLYSFMLYELFERSFLNFTLYLVGDPDTQLTYSDTVFGYFTNSTIDWYSAQLSCLDWGGNLATIKSAEEDSLLFYSITDITNEFTCHIGLNDVDNDAGTNGSEFVWIDGSTSSFRNFGKLNHIFPRDENNYDCVRHRYRNSSDALSQGWLNAPCSDERNCYFCSKPGKHCP